MDIAVEKLKLIEWLAGLNDPIILEEFVSLKEKKSKDWWDGLSEEEKEDIRIGLSQAEKGELSAHENVMGRFQKWM